MTSYFFLWSCKNKLGWSTHPVLAMYYIDSARDDLITPVSMWARFSTAPAAPSTTLWRTHALADAIRKVVPTTHLPRSRIRTGMTGSSRRSRRGFTAASGTWRDHRPWTLQSWQGSSARRQSTTATSRRHTSSITGGLVRALSERASERQQSGGGSSRRRSLNGGGPFTFFPDD